MPRRVLLERHFAAPTLDVARALLGCTLVHGNCAGVIVEVEAYGVDAASHFVTRPRTGAIMGEGHGRIYVYSIYGVHHCLNFTTDASGPGAVLIRALEPTRGIESMKERRGSERLADLCSGPARLVQALAVDPALTGRRVTDAFEIVRPRHAPDIAAGPRIGISEAKNLPWRLVVKGSPFLSRRT